MTSKLTFSAAALVAVTFGFNADADSISLNFMENTGNQVFAGGENIGPFGTNSSNWNNPVDASGTGSATNLVDDSGANTGASVSWASSNTWFNASGTANDDQRLAVGYLDDGAPGVNVTFSNIPYAQYEVTLLFGSDQGGGDTYTTLDFTVNGNALFGGTATAYTNIGSANTLGGSNWVEITGGNTGNYATIAGSGSSLVIQGQARNNDQRGSLVGVVVNEVPEPGSLALLGLGGLMVARRRRG